MQAGREGFNVHPEEDMSDGGSPEGFLGSENTLRDTRMVGVCPYP